MSSKVHATTSEDVFNKTLFNKFNALKKVLMTKDVYSGLIEKYKAAKNNRGTKTNQQYYLLSRYELVERDDGQERLIRKRQSEQERPLYFVTIEETYSVIREAHQATGHGNVDKMTNYLNDKYANVTRESVELFRSLCSECRHHASSLNNTAKAAALLSSANQRRPRVPYDSPHNVLQQQNEALVQALAQVTTHLSDSVTISPVPTNAQINGGGSSSENGNRNNSNEPEQLTVRCEPTIFTDDEHSSQPSQPLNGGLDAAALQQWAAAMMYNKAALAAGFPGAQSAASAAAAAIPSVQSALQAALSAAGSPYMSQFGNPSNAGSGGNSASSSGGRHHSGYPVNGSTSSSSSAAKRARMDARALDGNGGVVDNGYATNNHHHHNNSGHSSSLPHRTPSSQHNNHHHHLNNNHHGNNAAAVGAINNNSTTTTSASVYNNNNAASDVSGGGDSKKRLRHLEAQVLQEKLRFFQRGLEVINVLEKTLEQHQKMLQVKEQCQRLKMELLLMQLGDEGRSQANGDTIEDDNDDQVQDAEEIKEERDEGVMENGGSEAAREMDDDDDDDDVDHHRDEEEEGRASPLHDESMPPDEDSCTQPDNVSEEERLKIDEDAQNDDDDDENNVDDDDHVIKDGGGDGDDHDDVDCNDDDNNEGNSVVPNGEHEDE